MPIKKKESTKIKAIPNKRTASTKKNYFTLNGKKVEFEPGDTIGKVAYRNGVQIPGLCYHPDFCAKGNCRVCVVEVEGKRTLQTACSTPAEAGMVVRTDTDRVRKARDLNIELIFAEHIEKCPTCIWRVNCKLLKLADKYKIEIKHFHDRKYKRATFKFANAVELDSSQCIDCRNCVDACSQIQKINYLEVVGKGHNQEIRPVDEFDTECIYCGQCAAHCPVGAAQEQAEWDKVEFLLKHKKGKVLVAQFAPSVRITIGEEFGMPYGTNAEHQLAEALKLLGFDYVFDVNFSADITTIVEAQELLERVGRSLKAPKSKNLSPELPMITSCCPAWVKYIEFYYPEYLSHLTTSRSPHIHGGGVVKSYFAQKQGINPKDIIVVSIMPCTAKKFEASRPELKVSGSKPVDFVLTTRETAWLISKHGIDLKNLQGVKADNPMGEGSGASVIYGSSGGVMESALRTAQYLACKDKKKATLCETRIDFKEVRGLEGVKEAVVNVGAVKARVAVVNGIGNIEKVIANLDKYDYIEVMACDGGCLGGGGQPYPTTPDIRKMRMEGIYAIDKGKKIRKAHDNKAVLEVLLWLKEKGHQTEHGVLHTHYTNRRK